MSNYDQIDLDQPFLKPAELGKIAGATAKQVANYADRHFFPDSGGEGRGRGRARLFSVRAALWLRLATELETVFPGTVATIKRTVCDGVFGRGRFDWKQYFEVYFGLQNGVVQSDQNGCRPNSIVALSIEWLPLVKEVFAALESLGAPVIFQVRPHGYARANPRFHQHPLPFLQQDE